MHGLIPGSPLTETGGLGQHQKEAPGARILGFQNSFPGRSMGRWRQVTSSERGLLLLLERGSLGAEGETGENHSQKSP